MPALWGKRMIGLALVPVLCLLAAGLNGCEYSSDSDEPRVADSPPSSSSSGGQSAQESQQGSIDALTEILGFPDGSGLPYASASAASWSAEIPAGTYILTAACVAAPAADLVVRLGNAEPERTTFGCGTGKVVYLDHQGGRISAEIVPLTDAPHVFTGVRLDPGPAAWDQETSR
ncbi:hypothetical protein [Arthrobacter sp. ISL-72]|uniref:hypothetical protein n=1 Tax=Arthrobacter sp. ISL-72 TaxID=2819114 RepID=UPI001BEC1B1D|nr:hypothetical protein [Arthrobacter sp. ISL-72]MBT2596356.1 hypothetical protein [Arthrobacter sp. ISL-72]